MNPYRKDPRPVAVVEAPRDRAASYRAAQRRLALSVVMAATAAFVIPLLARSCHSKHVPAVPSELLTAGATFPETPSDLRPAVPLEPLLVADAPDRLAVLEPTEAALNLRPGEPLVVRFNRPMVDGARVGKPTDGEPFAWIPSVRGRTIWTSRSAVSFEAEAATWEATRTATMRLSSELHSLAGEPMVDALEHTVVFDAGPRLVRQKSSRLLPDEPARLLFTGKIDRTTLGLGLMAYEVDGGRRMLPFTVSVPSPDAKGETLVSVHLKSTLEPGARFAIAVAPPFSRGGAEPRAVAFELEPRPRVEGIDCSSESKEASDCQFAEPPGKIVDIAESLRLLSSTAIADLSPGSIEVIPPLDGLVTKVEDRRRLVVRGNWTPGQVYQVRVQNLRDDRGHKLERLPPLAVRSAGRPPEIRSATGHLTFERDAPPKIALAGIHVEDGEARVAAVSSGEEIAALLHPESLLGNGKVDTFASVALQTLVPTSRPNRWGAGSLGWVDLAPGHSSMAVVSLVAKKPAADELPIDAQPTTFVQRTDLGIDAKVLSGGVLTWTTSIADATPIAHAAVLIADKNGLPIALASTDQHGVAWFPIRDATRLTDGIVVRATKGDDRAVLNVDPRTSIGPRHLGMTPDAAPPSEEEIVATVFTDRGIVRPSETFHVKAMLRTHSRGALVAPALGSARIVVFAPGGEAPIAERRSPMSSFGTIDADFTLGAAATSGAHRIEVLVDGQKARAGTTTFMVGNYRPATFRVDLSAPSDNLAPPDTLVMDVVAAHLFGAPAAGMRAHFTITRQAANPPDHFDDYTFSSVDSSMREGTMASGDLILDEAGQAVVSAPVEIGAAVRADAEVEVDVSDLSGLTTSARRTVALYPASFEVGMRRVPAWVEPNTPLDVNAIVIAHDGSLVKDRPVEARILRESWHTYWEWAAGKSEPTDASDEEENSQGSFQARRAHHSDLAHRCALVSGSEPVHCSWKPERSGTYLIEAITRDERGRTTTASQRVYVAAPDEHPDRDPPGTSLTLTPAKASLEVGETAEIAFESPFQKGYALLEIERDGVLSTEVREVTSGGNVFRFPVTAAMVPNAFVSLSLVKPRTGPPQPKIDLGAPDLRIGITELTVRPAASPLTVSLVTNGLAQAGSDVPIDVFVENANGDGVESEVALYAVDEGTLRVTAYATPDPLSGLFPRMAPSFAWEDLRRSLVSRVLDPLVPEAGGDGGEQAAMRAPEQLDRFETTPLWLPHVVTDQTGHASVTLQLPERPTQYRVMAVATDAGIRAGRAEATVVATMPLIVRPSLPLVATVGDRFEAVAFIHNTEETPIDVSVTPDVDGFQRSAIAVHLEPKGEARVGEWVDVERAGDLSIRFEASSERGATQAEARVRVAPRARIVHAHAVGAVNQSRTIALESLSAGAEPISLVVASHPFVGFDTALDALLASPDAGVEAAAATLIGLAADATLDSEARSGNLSAPELEARAQSTVARLFSMQNASGGFGDFTSKDEPDDYLTAFALHALSSARRAGLEVDAASRKRAVTFLETRVRGTAFLDRDGPNGGNVTNIAGHDELAFALRVLSEEGEADDERISALFDQREILTPYGLAELALAMGPNDFRRVTLISDAQKRILVTSADQHQTVSALRWYDSSARTLGAVLEAASSTESMLDVTPTFASRLLQTRSKESASWWSTHETSYALAGLAAYATTFRDDDPIDASVHIDGAWVRPTQMTPRFTRYSVPVDALSAGAHRLEIDVKGLAWFAISQNSTIALGDADTIARGNEAALHRTFEDARGMPLASGAHLHLGDLIRVRLFLFNEHEAPPYIAIRDHLAGGLEPIDDAHETSPRESLSALLGMSSDDEVIDARAHYATRSLDEISHRMFLPEQAVFYLAHPGPGLHEVTYGVRAMTVGSFVMPPAEVGALYSPGFSARSATATFTVDP